MDCPPVSSHHFLRVGSLQNPWKYIGTAMIIRGYVPSILHICREAPISKPNLFLLPGRLHILYPSILTTQRKKDHPLVMRHRLPKFLTRVGTLRSWLLPRLSSTLNSSAGDPEPSSPNAYRLHTIVQRRRQLNPVQTRNITHN